MKSGKEIYQLAEKKFKNNNIEEAIPLYELLLDNPDYESKVSTRLINFYLNQHDYDLARKILDQEKSKDHPSFYPQLSSLEYKEMNYQSALKVDQGNLSTKLSQEAYIYMLANIERSYGEKKVATNLYELLLNSKIYGGRAFISLIGLDLENQNYKQLERKINQINSANIPKDNIMTFKLLRELLDFYQEGKFSKQISYSAKRIIENKEEDLLDHLEKHRESKENNKSHFLKYIDFKALVKLAEQQISLSNPTYITHSATYIITADSIIGTKNGKFINTFKAVTICGSPNIITMYPISVSDQFDKEGSREDQTILAKRLGGGKLDETRRKISCTFKLFQRPFNHFYNYACFYEHSTSSDSRFYKKWHFNQRRMGTL